MPKDRRLNFLSSDRARASPYACSSKDSNNGKLESSLPLVGDEKEWEEARCPICMEHPHNAVLLLCTSRDKGCHTFMCDTSDRHSNCLDQFCKSVAGDRVHEILCPLCRGQINGLVVMENARCYMNSKVRSCSLESCNFTGNYIELRKHARREHPTAKPSDVDPERQAEWVSLEHERDLRDTLSLVQSQFGYDSYDYSPDGNSDSGISDETEDEWSDSSEDASGISDETEDEWSDSSEDAAMSVDFDVGVEFAFSLLNEFTFGPSDAARNSSNARSGAISLNSTSMTSRSRAYFRSGITPRRRNTTPSRSDSEGMRERSGGRLLNRRLIRSSSRSGSEGVRERTGGRSLNRRLMRSRSRSNDQEEITFHRRQNTTPSWSRGLRNTGNERTFGWSLGRRSVRSRSRPNPQADTPPRVSRNTGSGRISGGSFGSRSNP